MMEQSGYEGRRPTVFTQGSFPSRGVWRRPALRPIDVVVGAAVLALLYGLLRLAPALNVPFVPSHTTTNVSTDPADLPYYAARSLLRMFIALFRGSSLGLECASIFAIFTSMAWNITFTFYHSLVSQQRDLDEAAR